MAKLNRRTVLAIGVGSALTALTTALWAAPKFLSGSIQSVGTRRTRVILKSDGEFNYRYFTLTQPDRLVIDVDGMVQNQALMELAKKVPAADSFIARIRLGQKDANTVRIVFDLKRPIYAKIVRQQNHLLIDLSESKPMLVGQKPHQSSDNNTLDKNKQEDTLGNFIEEKKQAKITSSRRPVIVLDAGHGGKDPGAMSPRTGVKEKDIALSYARETKKLLEAKGYNVYMTRDDDTFIKLAERRRKAREVKADLFLSIHVNSSENHLVRGSDVFVWGARANSESARKLAQAENDADYVDGMPSVGNKDVDVILTDMMRTQTETDSSRLGNAMLQRFAYYGKVLQKNVDRGDFVVLRSLDIPSVLVELGFISNAEDEKLLLNKTHQHNMAVAMADSVEIYLKNTILNQ